MIVIILDELPNYSNAYEQGIDLIMAAADYEIESCLMLSDNFANFLKEQANNSIYIKKLKQIELFEIKAYSNIALELQIIEYIDKQKYNDIFMKASKVMVL